MSEESVTRTHIQSAKILSLPDELIAIIIGHVHDHDSQVSIAGACARLKRIVEADIYKTILMTKGSAATALCEALEAHPERYRFVRDIAIRYQAQNESGIEHLSPALQQMRNLRSIHLETPCFNDSPWVGDEGKWDVRGLIDYNELFQHTSLLCEPSERSFSHLQKLRLHAHLAKPHQLQLPALCFIFESATLTYLHVECVDLTSSINYSEMNLQSELKTPLETLIIEECQVSVAGLKRILCRPKALRRLEIRERIHYRVENSMEPTELGFDPVGFAEVLSLQGSSLEHLLHYSQHPTASRPALLHCFRDALPNVKALELGAGSVIFGFHMKGGHTVSNKSLKLIQVSLGLVRSMRDFMEDIYVHWLPAMSSAERDSLPIQFRTKPSLLDHSKIHVPRYRLELNLAPWGQFSEVETEYDDCRALKGEVFGTPEGRKYIYELAAYLARRDCKLVISGTTTVPYIPPYMYGERRPSEQVLYDSMDPFCFGGDYHWHVLPEVGQV